MLPRRLTLQQTTEWILIAIAVLLVAGRVFGGRLSGVPLKDQPGPVTPVPTGPCQGEPVIVDYAYSGRYIEDFACQGKCDSPHYVLYSNGLATQCGLMPPDTFCSDKQEDASLSCTPPATLTPAKK